MTKTCKRCHSAPGTQKFYYPWPDGKIRFALAGVQPKLSVKSTVACEPCWTAFQEYCEGLAGGTVDPDPSYHA